VIRERTAFCNTHHRPRMNVLIIGLSSIATRRVIPALAGLSLVSKIHLASRRDVGDSILPTSKRGRFFLGYDTALRELEPGIAYISLPNSLHATWVRRALASGFHVIVDKPACTALSETEDLLREAADRRLCVTEATVWAYHPWFKAVQELLGRLDGGITRLTASFSFPPLPEGDFRNDPQLGGGALLDLGPYAASCGRSFFGEPTEVIARFTSRSIDTGLETSFSVLATYPGGRAIVGHFGFDTEYRNTISLVGPRIAMDVERAFTTPPSLAPIVHWRKTNQADCLSCPAGDSFALFLEAVLVAIQNQRWQHLADAMIQDARFLHQLRTSAEGKA
jgi:dTDP-3,4-didehydro-2,6-dideoxy-alpha-D-glucose 3-reductase